MTQEVRQNEIFENQGKSLEADFLLEFTVMRWQLAMKASPECVKIPGVNQGRK